MRPKPEGVVDLREIVGRAIAQDAGGHGPGTQRSLCRSSGSCRLQRRVRAQPPRATGGGVGCVETRQQRIGRRSPKEGVQAPAVSVRPGAGFPDTLDLPQPHHALGLWREDAGPANRIAEQPAGFEADVAHDLGIQPNARLPRQQAVVRIDVGQFWTHGGRLPIRRRRDDQSMQGFSTPGLGR